MPNLLALDTATEACSIALNVGDELHSYFDVVPQRHSELVLGKIESLLSEANITLNTINTIAFGCGPGSFMGVRIATSVAQGLAFGIDCSVIPISTLQALAQTAYEETKAPNVIVGWDARMGGIYWGIYELKNGLMEPVVKDSLSNPNDIQLPAHGEWLAVGNVWKAYRVDRLPSLVKTDLYPQASAIITLGQDRLRRGETQLPEDAEPVYLRNQVTNSP